MRIFPMKTSASTGSSEVYQPSTNTVGIQVGIGAVGAVAATFQVKGRATADLPWENIGSPVSISGTNTASGSMQLTNVVAGQIVADFSLASCLSLSCVAVEADK